MAAAKGDAAVGSRASSRRRVAAPIPSSRAGVATCGDAPSACCSASAASSASSIPAGFSEIRSATSRARSSSRSPGKALSSAISHSAAIQTASRLQEDHLAGDGTVYHKGTAIPHRADFNTLDNPFFWSAHPDRDRLQDTPVAGVHFVVFNPTSDDFERTRLAMDGVLPGGKKLAIPPGDRGQGINSVLTTTHRQNFLVPPRRHRSFPLSEL